MGRPLPPRADRRPRPRTPHHPHRAPAPRPGRPLPLVRGLRPGRRGLGQLRRVHRLRHAPHPQRVPDPRPPRAARPPPHRPAARHGRHRHEGPRPVTEHLFDRCHWTKIRPRCEHDASTTRAPSSPELPHRVALREGKTDPGPRAAASAGPASLKSGPCHPN